MAANPVLQLDPRRTLVRGQGEDGQGSPEVRIGWQDLAEAFHVPVSGADIELAIERVEDAIGHPRIDIVGTLAAPGDETLGRLADAAGLARDPGTVLTTESVEGLFSRLARQAAGGLPSADQLPEDARFAATLVLVRELMHHLGVPTLGIGPSA